MQGRAPGRPPIFREEREIRFKPKSISLPEPLWLKLEAQQKRWMESSLSATLRRVLAEWFETHPVQAVEEHAA